MERGKVRKDKGKGPARDRIRLTGKEERKKEAGDKIQEKEKGKTKANGKDEKGKRKDKGVEKRKEQGKAAEKREKQPGGEQEERDPGNVASPAPQPAVSHAGPPRPPPRGHCPARPASLLRLLRAPAGRGWGAGCPSGFQARPAALPAVQRGRTSPWVVSHQSGRTRCVIPGTHSLWNVQGFWVYAGAFGSSGPFRWLLLALLRGFRTETLFRPARCAQRSWSSWPGSWAWSGFLGQHDLNYSQRFNPWRCIGQMGLCLFDKGVQNHVFVRCWILNPGSFT